MRSDVHPGDLPGERERSPLVRDVSSYLDIVTAAEAVYNFCGKGSVRVPGWAVVGKCCLNDGPLFASACETHLMILLGTGAQRGMAVALWGTGSSIDRRYPDLRSIQVPVETS